MGKTVTPIDDLLSLLQNIDVCSDDKPTCDIPTKDIIEMMKSSGHTYYLGGSRRMKELGAAVVLTKKTDFDFYVTYDEEVEAHLTRNGFYDTSATPDYFDSEVIRIMELGQVQVVLRKDAEFYRQVFDNIDPHYYYHMMWKSHPEGCKRDMIQPLFEMLFKFARGEHRA